MVSDEIFLNVFPIFACVDHMTLVAGPLSFFGLIIQTWYRVILFSCKLDAISRHFIPK